MYNEGKIVGDTEKILNGCLYFSTNSLARLITRLADEEFRVTGLSPAHAFVMMVVIDKPGIAPGEISNRLQIAPSTVTRFIDQLERKELLKRESEGKTVKIFSSQKGKELQENIDSAWKGLHDRYTNILGDKYSDVLTQLINDAIKKLE